MRATFIGDPRHPDDPRTDLVLFGVSFVLGKPMDVAHLTDAQKSKLSRHSHFKTDTAPANADPIVEAVGRKRGKKT